MLEINNVATLTYNFMHEHGQTHELEDQAHGKSHLSLMVLCCLIPAAAILVIAYINIESTYLPFLVALLCPLMMLLMYLPRMLQRKRISTVN